MAKASAGAVEHVRIAMTTNLAELLRRTKRPDLWSYAADAEGGAAPWEIDMTTGTIFVLGSEGSGIRPLVQKLCDAAVTIPQAGRIASLNVAVAAGTLLYEAARQRAVATPPAEHARTGPSLTFIPHLRDERERAFEFATNLAFSLAFRARTRYLLASRRSKVEVEVEGNDVSTRRKRESSDGPGGCAGRENASGTRCRRSGTGAAGSSGEAHALDQMIRRYAGFVRLKASSYFIAGGDSDDLIQEGLVGLYKAVHDYRVDREASFRSSPSSASPVRSSRPSRVRPATSTRR